jgi:hypothetical protein
MGSHGYLVLWCAVLGTVVLAGVIRTRRTVRVMGRIERVREPRNGSSQRDGISVVVSFQGPSTGQEFTVANDGRRGETITTAWTGREIGVFYPRERPHAFRFTKDLSADESEVVWAGCAGILIYAGLVVGAVSEWGWPWALLGLGVPWAFIAAGSILYDTGSKARHRNDRLTSQAAVEGRVVAVLKDVTSEGGTSHTPVVTFTTHEGTVFTAYCAKGLPDSPSSHGRDVTIHCTADDPADFTTDLASEHRSRKSDRIFNVVALALGLSVVAVGAVGFTL